MYDCDIFNPLTAGGAYIRFSFFISTINNYHLLNMLKDKMWH